MQKGKDDLAFAQLLPLVLLRLLHLNNYLGIDEDFIRRADDRSTRREIIFVGGVNSRAGAGFNKNLVAGSSKFPRGGGSESNPIFVVLYFLRDANSHSNSNSFLL